MGDKFAANAVLSPLAIAAVLAFTAGYADTLGFVLLGGLFIAHVTGNFVLIGAAMVTGAAGIIAKLATLPAFFLAVLAVHSATRPSTAQNGHRSFARMLALEAVLLSMLLALGVLWQPLHDPDGLHTVVVGCVGAMAMGVQNAAARLHLAQMPPSTLMTGNVTQVAIDLVDLGRTAAPERPAVVGRLKRMLVVVGAFAAGALVGAWCALQIKFWGVLLPAALIALLALVVGRRVAGTA